jgi:hypothetical protein
VTAASAVDEAPTGQAHGEVGRPFMASRLSGLDRLWIASLMKDADHHDSILVGVVKQRAGKSVQQDSSECAMDDLKC